MRVRRLLAFLAIALASCASQEEDLPPELQEATVLLEQGRLPEAFERLERSLEREPDSPAHLVLFAETCQRMGRIRRGVRAVEKARSLAPESHRALYVSALLDRDRHHPADAIESARRAAELAPEEIEYHLLLGNLRLAAADHAGAVDAFAAAQALAPDDLRAIGGYGQALVLAGHHREGRPFLDRYLERQPSDGQILYLRGLAESREKEYEAAEGDFRHAIRVAPHLPGPYHNLARILQMSGREDEAATMREIHAKVIERDWAIRAAQRKLADRPDDLETAQELARLLRQAGRNAEAAAVLRPFR